MDQCIQLIVVMVYYDNVKWQAFVDIYNKTTHVYIIKNKNLYMHNIMRLCY